MTDRLKKGKQTKESRDRLAVKNVGKDKTDRDGM